MVPCKFQAIFFNTKTTTNDTSDIVVRYIVLTQVNAGIHQVSHDNHNLILSKTFLRQAHPHTLGKTGCFIDRQFNIQGM